MSMMENIDSLDELVDESDPDVDFPNSFHAFQTAEGIRKEHPDKGERSAGTKVTDVALVYLDKTVFYKNTYLKLFL